MTFFCLYNLKYFKILMKWANYQLGFGFYPKKYFVNDPQMPYNNQNPRYLQICVIY